MTRDDPAAFAPPPAFGPFRVLHQIGIGALGPVFRTYEPTRDRLVAVKLFRLDVTPEQAQALADELGKACEAGLFHPSIVEPIAAGVEGTAAYRAEEYVAAESLDVAIRHYAPAALDKVLPFITQLAGAIDFARTAGVGHGGLHLRDVFVTPDEARASGFGIVESLERVGLRAPVRRPYSAPERIAGGSWSTPADVFSLAAIAYELLTARRPSGTGDQIGVLSGDTVGRHAAAVHAVLARAMDENPARRYPTALAFVSALDEAARGSAVAGVIPAAASIGSDRSPDQSADRSSDIGSSTRRGSESPVSAIAEAQPQQPPQAAKTVEREPAREPAPKPPPARIVDLPATIENAPFPEEEPSVQPAAAAPVAVAAPVVAAAPVIAAAALTKEADSDLGAHAEQPAPTLFDAPEQEPLTDFAIDDAALRATEPAKWQYEPVEEVPAIETRELFTQPERPRMAMLPVAFALILGLLIGFAGGYAFFAGRGDTGAPSTSAAASPTAPAAAPQPSTAQPQRSGRTWSEQAIAQPGAPPQAGRGGQVRSAAPPVPGDVPPIPETGSRPRTANVPPTPAPAATHGSLTVESTPKNAVVTVNGKWRGRTPLTIDDLSFGTHTIRIVQPGYTVARDVVTLSKAQPARTVTFRLERPAPAAQPEVQAQPSRGAAPPRDQFSGSVFVASNPAGARIFIDGRPFGTAPARIPGIAIGSHVVRLELPDHRIWTTSTRVAAGQETRVTASLERIRIQ